MNSKEEEDVSQVIYTTLNEYSIDWLIREKEIHSQFEQGPGRDDGATETTWEAREAFCPSR